jgi:hypothetical protein
VQRKSLAIAATVCVALVVVVAASAERPPITQASSGKVVRIAKGDSAKLRLSNRWFWSDPTVSSSKVELTPVEYLVDPGFREWTIDANRVGRATIRSFGRPNCSTCPRPTRSFVVTVVVTP